MRGIFPPFLLAAALCCCLSGCGGCSYPVAQPKPTAVTYVYEKDDTAIPSGVKTGLNRLNREFNVVASTYEDDTPDGTGEVPEQYKAPLAAAKQAGLPALVVTAGPTVLKVVPNPQSEAAVMEAVK